MLSVQIVVSVFWGVGDGIGWTEIFSARDGYRVTSFINPESNVVYLAVLWGWGLGGWQAGDIDLIAINGGGVNNSLILTRSAAGECVFGSWVVYGK